jgi:hypothetical protein
MARLNLMLVRRWVTKAAVDNPQGLSTELAERFGVSRVAAASTLRKLVAEGWIVREGTTRPTYVLGKKRRISNSYKLPGVDEQTCWERDFLPYFDLPPNVENICHHGFTEMLNNANDHSSGTSVYVGMWQDNDEVSIAIADNGIGIFERITSALGLPDRRLALLELSKGKLTTDPGRHSGEGIFFTSRMFDRFVIDANGLHYAHDTNDGQDWLLEEDFSEEGTSVRMEMPTSSTRTAREVFEGFTSGPDDFSFDKTVVPVRLARLGNENLLSRSQAKRLIQRFDRFRTVVLDFTGVPEIGQAFADELFRVFARQHPEINLIPIETVPAVSSMIARAISA